MEPLVNEIQLTSFQKLSMLMPKASQTREYDHYRIDRGVEIDQDYSHKTNAHVWTLIESCPKKRNDLLR